MTDMMSEEVVHVGEKRGVAARETAGGCKSTPVYRAGPHDCQLPSQAHWVEPAGKQRNARLHH